MYPMNEIAAINTFALFCKLESEGQYFNSPDSLFFNGSALGYWKRVCLAMGVTMGELNGIMLDSNLACSNETP